MPSQRVIWYALPQNQSVLSRAPRFGDNLEVSCIKSPQTKLCPKLRGFSNISKMRQSDPLTKSFFLARSPAKMNWHIRSSVGGVRQIGVTCITSLKIAIIPFRTADLSNISKMRQSHAIAKRYILAHSC